MGRSSLQTPRAVPCWTRRVRQPAAHRCGFAVQHVRERSQLSPEEQLGWGAAPCPAAPRALGVPLAPLSPLAPRPGTSFCFPSHSWWVSGFDLHFGSLSQSPVYARALSTSFCGGRRSVARGQIEAPPKSCQFCEQRAAPFPTISCSELSLAAALGLGRSSQLSHTAPGARGSCCCCCCLRAGAASSECLSSAAIRTCSDRSTRRALEEISAAAGGLFL